MLVLGRLIPPRTETHDTVGTYNTANVGDTPREHTISCFAGRPAVTLARQHTTVRTVYVYVLRGGGNE